MSATGATILIVDDVAAQRLAMEVTLAELGEAIVTVDSGRAALRYLLTRDVAVVLLDANMPGLDGFETAALIRERPRSRHTPIIFVTSDPDELRAARAYSLGAVDYIISPYAPEMLRTKVSVFVELSRMHARLAEQAEERVALAREQAARAAAEESGRRLRLLAEAAAVLARPVQRDSVFADFLRMVLPSMGDAGGVVLLDGQGQVTEHWAHVDLPDGLGVGLPIGGVDPEIADAVERGRTSGKVEVVMANGEGPRAVVVPLLAHGTIVGLLALAMTASGRRYAEADVDLACDLASRVSLAAESRRLYLEIESRDRRKDEFLAMLGHELRNPLGAITTAVRLLERTMAPSEPAVRARDVIARQVVHLARLVDDLLDVARVTTGRITLQRRPVDLKELVERTVAAFSASGRLARHVVSVDAERLHVEADPTRLDQVLTNLLTNALKYTDEGGRVSLTVKAEGQSGVLRVHDTGIGISAETLPQVFDLFVQGRQSADRTQGGLGIGLTLVRRLVELQGGSVHAASDGPGRGSVFTVRLPLAATSSSPGDVDDTRTLNDGGPLRVLVVEDNTDARDMLHALLEHAGHEVHEAADGPSAVELAIEIRPDLALVDLGLPGFDGLEVASRVRAAIGDEALLVALTGYGQPLDRQRTRRAGFDAHLVKPVSSDGLSGVLAAAGARAAGRARAPIPD
jgi:signal transduction histidine kinase/DNA-binding response OmpR family regulator